MTIPTKRWLLDTNVWIFALRRDDSHQACVELLTLVGTFTAVIPRQVLQELNLNLIEDEIYDFYQRINENPDFFDLNWERAPVERVKFYETQGCRKGDAVIAAHAEALGVRTIVSENRQFLRTIKASELEIVTAAEAKALCPRLRWRSRLGPE